MRHTTHKNIWVSLFAVLVMAAWVTGCEKKSDVQKIEEKAKSSTEQAVDAVKDAATKTGAAAKDIATNVAEKVKEGAQKAGSAATNVVGEVKEKLN